MSAIVRAPSQQRSADEGPLSEKPKTNSSNSPSRSPSSVQRERQAHNLPTHNGQINPTGRSDEQDDGDVRLGRLRVRAAGESGRKGFHPWHFFRVAYRSSSTLSSYVNLLWPVVPAAIAVRYSLPDHYMLIFILSYIAMVPCANLIGFAGQELARKVPHVFGVLVETTLGSVVEIILFLVLLIRPTGEFQVIQSAILGSILATMLLCLGLCFFVGGLRRDEQEFEEAVSEAGTGLLQTAGFGLAVPTLFAHSVGNGNSNLTADELTQRALNISRASAVLLMVAYFVFLWFQMRTHHGIYDAIFAQDEERDHDSRDKGGVKPKFTLVESLVALCIAIPLVTVIAISLVDQIGLLVERQGVTEAFMGLILVPLVEKAAEHLGAIDEAWDNQMNFALSHVLGATLQTALFNAPLTVIVAWGMGIKFGLNFELFDIAMLILTIITVGQFLRDQKSNYLEGALCVTVYLAIAVAAFYYPKTISIIENGGEGNAGGGGA